MNKISCYINNNYIDIKKNNKINHYVLDSISNGDVIKSSSFIQDLKNKRIFSNIITSEINVYLNHKILEKDIFYYKSIFDELNCTKVNVYDTSKKLTSPTLINNNNYYILYINKEYIYINPDLLETYLDINNIKVLRIISSTKLPYYSNTKYYYYNNPKEYFLI